MDTTRIGFGEMVAGVSGLVLFIVMFLPWYGVSGEVGFGSYSYNAWESFDFIDLVLFLVAVVAIAAAAASAAGVTSAELPARPGQVVLVAGALAVLLILYRLIDTPGPDQSELVDVTRKVGVILGLLAAAGVAFGGYAAMTEEATGRSPMPRRRPPPA